MKSFSSLALVAILGLTRCGPFIQTVFSRAHEREANTAAFVGAGLMFTHGAFAVSCVPLERAVLRDADDSWGASVTVRATWP